MQLTINRCGYVKNDFSEIDESYLENNSYHLILASLNITEIILHVHHSTPLLKYLPLFKHCSRIKLIDKCNSSNTELLNFLFSLITEKSNILRRAAMCNKNLIEVYNELLL